MRYLSLALVLSALACMTACEKEKVPDPTPSTPAPTAALAPAASALPTAPAVATAIASAKAPAENIPVAADFEEEAEKSITKANYRAELDSIEAELK